MLVKKPDEIGDIQLPQAQATQPSKPEVYFIKYKTQHGGGGAAIGGGISASSSASGSAISSSSIGFGGNGGSVGHGSGSGGQISSGSASSSIGTGEFNIVKEFLRNCSDSNIVSLITYLRSYS